MADLEKSKQKAKPHELRYLFVSELTSLLVAADVEFIILLTVISCFPHILDNINPLVAQQLEAHYNDFRLWLMLMIISLSGLGALGLLRMHFLSPDK